MFAALRSTARFRRFHYQWPQTDRSRVAVIPARACSRRQTGPHCGHRQTRVSRWQPLAATAAICWQYRTLLGVPMLQGERPDRRHRVYAKEVRPFTDKQIELVRTSPTKPSSPSRTRGCSRRCRHERELTNRSNSRPRPATCSTSSAGRRSIYSRVRYASSRLPTRLARQRRDLCAREDGDISRIAASYG